MLDALLKALLAYLLGNLMGGRLIGRLRGVDLRASGSGNIGATNALRTQGSGFALAVLAIDLAKGVVAALWLPQLPTLGGAWLTVRDQAYVCGVAAALGHCYPALYGFRGGKGVATLAGVFIVLLTGAVGWMLAVFAVTLVASGYASLATLAGAATALVWVQLREPAGLASSAGAFALAMAALIVWTHRANISRLLHGEEHRFEKVRLIHRWRQR